MNLVRGKYEISVVLLEELSVPLNVTHPHETWLCFSGPGECLFFQDRVRLMRQLVESQSMSPSSFLSCLLAVE